MASHPGGSWRSFWHDPPGRRFALRYERHNRGSGAGTALRVLLGVFLIVLGIPFLVLPGPAFVPILAGAVLLAGESRRIAALLDRIELAVRRGLRR